MTTTTVRKPFLSFWQIWNMSFGFLGIQFGLGLQNANVSRIFQTLGGDVENLSLYWLAAPFTGMVVQPIIGYMSDRTWNVLGRRKPYFLFGAILASMALILMPNSTNLSGLIPALWIAIGVLWILDASINVSMEPFRAFVADMLPSEQRTTGFAMQSFFIGTGAVVASALPYVMNNWFDVPNTAPAGEIPPSVKYSFYMGAIAFITAVIWTVVKTKEYPPEQFNAFHGESVDAKHTSGGIREVISDFVQMPKTMKQLAVVQFFSWLALFAMWIYTTAVVTEYTFGSTDTSSKLYNEGADWVNIMFAVYNGVAALCAFILPVMARRTSRKTVHIISLIMGGLGLASIFFLRNQYALILSMVGVGVAWASILSMPYAILAGALPPKKMGMYMGIFNFFIVLPQIIAAGVLGFFIRNVFNGEVGLIMLLGGISMGIAALMVFFVRDVDDVAAAVPAEFRDTITKDLKVERS
jgi:maltose/moltooligosaccharide transporter